MHLCHTIFMTCLLILGACSSKNPPETEANPGHWKIENGKFYLDGQWQFLKIGKPLRNFADPAQVPQLIQDLPRLQSKNYHAIEINCYWHHFDLTGDGIPDVPLEPLNNLTWFIHKKSCNSEISKSYML